MSGNPNLITATCGGTETLQRILLSDSDHMMTFSIEALFSSPVPKIYEFHKFLRTRQLQIMNRAFLTILFKNISYILMLQQPHILYHSQLQQCQYYLKLYL